MSSFTLTGYAVDGSKRWQLQGTGASSDSALVTILHPDGVGYDAARTAYLSASVAQVNQTNRHVRLEHDVRIHTSDGLWFFAPVLHWIPDRDEMATDTPVRIETDHMLLRGRGAQGLTQLKRVTILDDIEVVLNPRDGDPSAPGGPDSSAVKAGAGSGSAAVKGGAAQQVTITCDGPLVFDYEHNVATFEQHVHVRDPSGDIYSDKLIAYFDGATRTIRYAEAIGQVRILQHQNTALSDRAMYEPGIGKITLVGKPSLLVYPSEAQQGVPLSFGGLATTAGSSLPKPIARELGVGKASGAPAQVSAPAGASDRSSERAAPTSSAYP